MKFKIFSSRVLVSRHGAKLTSHSAVTLAPRHRGSSQSVPELARLPIENLSQAALFAPARRRYQVISRLSLTHSKKGA